MIKLTNSKTGGGGHLLNNAFTLVELLGVIIILGVIALITFPIINKSIKSSKEKALEQVINNIEKAAYEYSVKNDIGYETYYKSLSLDTLTSAGLLKGDITNPVTNEQMQGCVLYKWVEEYKQYEFKYDENCSVKTLGEVVLEQFPYLATNGNGCITSTDNNYSYMGGCYLKGNPNNNSLWYSGFLWRIMGINADGTVRLITDENVTAIPWGANDTAQNWDESYAKDWLNNYFYPRLKENNIIVEQTWCSETTTSSSSARTTCTNNLSTEKAKVGLLTLDEYRLAGGYGSYLNIGQWQWTMTPNNSSSAWSVNDRDSGLSDSVSDTRGLRAVINVNSDVTITGGNGTLGATWSSQSGPYILNEDKNVEVTGKLNEKATNGEYVLYAEKKYRVVDKDSNGNTKLILDGYYEEDGNIFEMKYNDTSTNIFSTTTGIGQKLNGDVLNWLTNNNETEKGKLVTNYTWYQNNFDSGQSYTISLNEENPTRSIQATVGLIRIGEMLSSQSSSILTKGYTTISSNNNVERYWAITSRTSNYFPWNAWFVDRYGYSGNISFSSSLALRPVIVIKSDVEIISGMGTFSNPYQI